ncbi:hypothetical protein H0H93_004545 [Arthromyces matolae]|nr:hypothetical protein H0H93_004545 [Arthromyces matolae]
MEGPQTPQTPHHNQPAGKQTASKHVPYVFGTMLNGKDITEELGKPEQLPELAQLPEDLDTGDIDILMHIATDIKKRFKYVIRSIRDDRNAIIRATNYVLDGNETHLLYLPSRSKDVKMPNIPAPERSKLVGMIKASDGELRQEIYTRNWNLKVLSKAARSRTIPNGLHINNVYATWKLHPMDLSLNRFEPEQATSYSFTKACNGGPDTCYSFTKACNGGDVTQGIGLPKKMPNVASLPKDLDWWMLDTLRAVAMDISRRYKAIAKDIRDDKREIVKAIAYVEGRRFRPSNRKFDIVVPELPQPDVPQQYLVEMIEHFHKRLQSEVYERNRAFINLSKVPHLRNILAPGPDKQNVYVDYWENGEIELDGDSGGGGTANVLPPTRKHPATDAVDTQPTGGSNTKRLRTPYDITEDEALADMLEETAAALNACQDDVHSPWHPHHVKPGTVSAHLNRGFTHDAHVPSTSTPIPHDQSNVTIPIDPRLAPWQPPSEDHNEHPHGSFF